MAITQAMCTSFKKEILEGVHNFKNLVAIRLSWRFMRLAAAESLRPQRLLAQRLLRLPLQAKLLLAAHTRPAAVA